MFHNICTPNIAHFGKQCFQTTKVLRTSCFLIPGSRHFHQEHTFKTANDCSIHRLGNSSNHYLFEINRERQKYRKRRFSYRNQMGMLCGIMGTAAVFGMGSALCETKDDVSDKDLSFNSAAAFTKLNVSSEEFLENKNSDQIGQDVVGTEKISSENQSSSSSANSQEVKITSVEEIVKKSRKLLKHCMEEGGAPGLTIAVSVDGKTAWEDGFGFADLENNVRCSPNTVMRIASISKSLTMAVVAKLWEDGKLDLDAPIQKYIPSFPVKTFNGEEVTITTRHLISHQSGIRHYKSRGSDKKEKEEEKKRTTTVSKNENMKGKEDKANKSQDKTANVMNTKETISGSKSLDKKQNENIVTDGITTVANGKSTEHNGKAKEKPSSTRQYKKEEGEYEFGKQEYYIKKEYETIQEALMLFQNDDLLFKPGSSYLYTTLGWTVVSGVVEGAAGKPFTRVITRLFYDLGLENTYLDKNAPIIYNRARYYVRDKLGKLKNAPYVDNSYKWAGGGFLSTVQDLSKFGNIMLYASQQESGEGTNGLRGFLKASTMQALWAPVKGTSMSYTDEGYGMGWATMEGKSLYGFCRSSRHYAFHGGGAVGASSVLLILPRQDHCIEDNGTFPKGVVVAIITNMQDVRLKNVALEIAHLFENMQ